MRLEAGGTSIDRSREIAFDVDGIRYAGYAGDTIASALIATGRLSCGPSVSRDRPRGIVSAGVEEPNALVEVARARDGAPESMLPATTVEIADGLRARYLSGIGRLDPAADGAVADHTHVHADVVVVGAGPSGLAAAREAAAAGKRTILMDEQIAPGGSLLSEPAVDAQIAREMAELGAADEFTYLPRTTAFGSYDAGYIVAFERGDDTEPGATHRRIWHVRALEVILATGAHERPLVFENNDRPGIMLAGSVRTYLNRYAACAGDNVVVATTNDAAYDLVDDLHDAGIRVAAVVDARPDPSPRAGAARDRTGVDLRLGCAVVGTDADASGRVSAAIVSALDGDSAPVGETQTIACDLLAVSGGHSPVVHLHSQRQGALRWDDEAAAFVPDGAVRGQRIVGAANGGGDLVSWQGTVRPLWTMPGPLDDWSEHFVDLQRNQTVADVRRAIGAGMRSVEHVKRYTSISTANDQGKTSGVNTIGVIAHALGVADLGAVGTTTFRPPYTPVPFAALAGRKRGDLLDPARLTAMHDRHVALGAVFEDVGQWKRPRYYPRDGEDMDAAVRRECAAARESVAFMDASTLGKIEIRGSDAGAFLDRIYTNGFSKLTVGAGRYGVMCTADGMIFDDGVTVRLADDRYYMTTTTGGAATVLDWLEEWHQTEWPHLDVFFTSVTEQWATVAVVGPRSRDVMRHLCPDLDVSAEGFRFLAVRETTLAGGIPARIARVSFSGELAFEISAAAFWGSAVWDAVRAAGAAFDITPYGTETMHVLRAEKGFLIVGQDTDGTVTPYDAGMAWVVSKTKDFIGKRSFSRPDTARTDRRQLVGILPVDGATRVAEGAQLVETGTPLTPDSRPVPMIGHVTSAYSSAALARPFGLALVDNGRARIGGVATAFFDGITADVEIVSPVLFDPDGTRRDGDPPEAHGEPVSPARARWTPTLVSPAARLADEMAALTGSARLREMPVATQIGIRAAPGSAAARVVERELGIRLPGARGEVTGVAGALHAMWVSPDEFVAVDPSGAPATPLVARIAAALDGAPDGGRLPGQVVDLSAARTMLELSGPRARAVLEKGCPDDLHPRAFPAGRAMVSRVGAAAILLHHASEGTYRLLPRSSFADHLVRWIIDAAAEFTP